MLKKIFILTLILAATLLGYRSYQSSQHKHQVFLLEQTLFPELSNELQKANLKIQPLRTVLGKDFFKVVVSSPETGVDLESLRRSVFEIIEKWKTQNQKFGKLQHSVHFASEMTAP